MYFNFALSPADASLFFGFLRSFRTTFLARLPSLLRGLAVVFGLVVFGLRTRTDRGGRGRHGLGCGRRLPGSGLFPSSPRRLRFRFPRSLGISWRGSHFFTLLFLFSLFRFLRLVLDSREIFQNLGALLGSLSFSTQLQFEKLVDDFVELLAALDSQCLKFACRR